MSRAPASNPREPDELPRRPTQGADPDGETQRETIEAPCGSVSTRDPDLTADLLAELGLLPSPGLLARYRIAVPEMPAVIVGWIDAQITHRMELERMTVVAREARRARGQFLSAAIAVTGLLCAAAAGMFGGPMVASVIAIVSIGGPTTAVALARMVAAGRVAARSSGGGEGQT